MDTELAVSTFDFRGGDFGNAFYEGKDFQHFIERLFQGCHAYVFMVDPGIILASTSSCDAGSDAHIMRERAAAVIVSLEKLRQKRAFQLFHRPIAVVFSKSDLYPEVARDPEGFARQFMPATYKYLHQHVRRFRFFAVSSTGPLDDPSRPPRQLVPQGVLEPLLWCGDAHRKRGALILKLAVCVMLMAAVCVYGWLHQSHSRTIEALRTSIPTSNSDQLHQLYLQAMQLDGWNWFLLTHPLARRGVVADVLKAAEMRLDRDLAQRKGADGHLRTLQDYQSALEAISRFGEQYPGTEAALRGSDWLAVERNTAAKNVLKRLEELARTGSERQFNDVKAGDYQKVATLDSDEKVSALSTLLHRTILRQRLQSMWTQFEPSKLSSIESVVSVT